MNKDLCQKIDQDDLIEKYISGELQGRLKEQVGEHIKECPKHAEAVRLEQALSSGVRDYARSELKTRLTYHIKKQEISKYYILRYAAILVVAIMTPILLYYQFTGKPADISETETRMEVPSPAQSSTRIKTQEEAQPAISAKRSMQKPEEVSSASAGESEGLDIAGPAAVEPDLIIQPDQPLLYQDFRQLLDNVGKEILNCVPKTGMGLVTVIEIEIILQPNRDRDIQIITGKKISAQFKSCIQDIISGVDFPEVNQETRIRKIYTTK